MCLILFHPVPSTLTAYCNKCEHKCKGPAGISSSLCHKISLSLKKIDSQRYPKYTTGSTEKSRTLLCWHLNSLRSRFPQAAQILEGTLSLSPKTVLERSSGWLFGKPTPVVTHASKLLTKKTGKLYFKLLGVYQGLLWSCGWLTQEAGHVREQRLLPYWTGLCS